MKHVPSCMQLWDAGELITEARFALGRKDDM
jgi:hypothetical protein